MVTTAAGKSFSKVIHIWEIASHVEQLYFFFVMCVFRYSLEDKIYEHFLPRKKQNHLCVDWQFLKLQTDG